MRHPIAIKRTFSFDKFELGSLLIITKIIENKLEIPVAGLLLVEKEYNRYKFNTLFSVPGVMVLPEHSFVHNRSGGYWYSRTGILKLEIHEDIYKLDLEYICASDLKLGEPLKTKFFLDILRVQSK